MPDAVAPTPAHVYESGIDDAASALLFTEARTVYDFSDRPVSDEQLARIWELARWAPTSANTQPLRLVWVRTPEAREHLVPLMAEFNRAKVASAPATAILAIDPDFHTRAQELVPYAPEVWAGFEADADVRADYARTGGFMQAAYFILAVRAAGLMAGPMAGLDLEAVRAEFLGDTDWQPILAVNVGHPSDQEWFPRLPRIDVDEVVRWA